MTGVRGSAVQVPFALSHSPFPPRREQAEAALDDGAEVDGRDEFGNTALIVAAQNGLKRLIKLLLRRGATINTANHSGNTPLHFAFMYGFESLGASGGCSVPPRPGRRTDASDLWGMVCSDGRRGAGEYLKEKGADDNALNGDGLTCYEGLGAGRDVLGEEET